MVRALVAAGALGAGVALVFGAAFLAFVLAGPPTLVWSTPRERMIVVDDGFQVLPPRGGGFRVLPGGGFVDPQDGVWVPGGRAEPRPIAPQVELIPVAPETLPPAEGEGTLGPATRG